MDIWLIPQVRREHIGNAFLNWVALFAGLAAQLSSYNLALVLLKDLQGEVAFAEGTGQDIKKIAFHRSEDVFLRSINLWILEGRYLLMVLIEIIIEV